MMSIALPRFKYSYSQGLEDRGDQYQRGRCAGQNRKLAQKLNITLQERAWRLVGAKVVGNFLTAL